MFNPCHACGRSQIHDVVYINSHQTVFHCVSHELLDRCRIPALARRAGRLSLLLYSPAQDGKHIKCFPLRAELATNLTRPGPRWPQTCQKGTSLFWAVLSEDIPEEKVSTIQEKGKLNRPSDKIASITHQPFCCSRRGPRVKFIASSARTGGHLMWPPS